MNTERLKSLIDAGDHEGILKFFSKACEAERRSVAELAIQRLKHEAKTFYLQPKPGTFTVNPRLGAAELVVLASCSFSQIKELGDKVRRGGADVCEILADRQPKWLDRWAEMMMEAEPGFWATVRELVRKTGCRPPQAENYILGMIYGVLDHNHIRRYDSKRTLAQALLDDPELLQHEVWRLFEVEGNGEHSLAAHDKYKYGRAETSWDQTLVRFCREGRLSRERLLDASLDALARDFAQFRAGWFARFHDMMEPTSVEQQARIESYVGLLASSIPTTVSWALKVVERIDKQWPLPAWKLIESLRPVLQARAKGTVSAALKFLARIAKRDPDSRVAACLVATTALAHESSEVQNAAIDLLEEYRSLASAELLQDIARYGAAVSPSVRSRLEGLAGRVEMGVAFPSAPEGESRRAIRNLADRIAALPSQLAELAGIPRARATLEAGRLDLTALDFNGTEFPRLDSAAALTPVADLEELIDLAAKVIEGAGGIDDVERVLDGLSRLCDQRPGDFARLTGPLAKRVTTLLRQPLGPFLDLGPIEDLLGVLRTWLSGKLHQPVRRKKARDFEAFEYDVEGKVSEIYVQRRGAAANSLSQRALEIATRVVAGAAQPLLSAPTHADGWIDPRVLVERIAATYKCGVEPASLDLVFALLRLAPDHRQEALAAAESLPGEPGAAVRYALGAARVRIGPTAGLWVGAARARSPWTDDDRLEKAHPGLGPDGALAARYEFRICKRDKWYYLQLKRWPVSSRHPDSSLVTVRLNCDTGDRMLFQIGAGVIQWQQSIWPIARESLFGQGAEAIAANLDWCEARWQNRCYLEPLLQADVPMRPMALLLLTLGLAAKEPGERGLATEALIAAIRDGRIDGAKLGSMMAQLWPGGLIKMARWTNALSDAARVSPLHAQVVFDALERAFQGDAEKLPRDSHALLDLFKELGLETGSRVNAEPTLKLLSKIRGSSKTGKAASAILALVETRGPQRNAALMQMVLEQRLLRAERWASRCTLRKRLMK